MTDDAWAGARAYERFMGRWSRAGSSAFVRWLAVPAGRSWVDVGSGTGALARAVLDLAAPAWVTGLEPSPSFLGFARREVVDPRVRFLAGEAASLPLEAATADVVASAFVLNFVPHPAAALREMVRVVRPGGSVAALVWDYRDGMAFLRRFWSAAARLEPAARSLDEGVRFPLCRPGPLEALFVAAGLEAVRVGTIEIETRFADFEDYWEPFLGGAGPAPSYLASLPDERRAALRARLEEDLRAGPDGAIALTARAWGVAGTVARPAT